MAKQRRNQLIAIGALIVGLVFLYQPYSVLLRGVALPLLIISAILSPIFFSEKRVIEIIAGLGLIAGFSFLYLPIPPVLRSSAFHLLAASAIAFGMTTNLIRFSESCSRGYRHNWACCPLPIFQSTLAKQRPPSHLDRHHCACDCIPTKIVNRARLNRCDCAWIGLPLSTFCYPALPNRLSGPPRRLGRVYCRCT